MSEANLNLIISLTLMVIAIISVWKDVYKPNPSISFFRRFTRIGIMLIITASVFTFVNYFKDYNTELKLGRADAAKAKADSIAEASRRKLDMSEEELKASQKSLYRLQLSTKNEILEGVDSSYSKSVKASNEALAKYHIKLIDSLHTVVGTLKMNANKTQLDLAPVVDNHPPVFLDKIGSDTIKFQFVSIDGTSYNIHLTAFFILRTPQTDLLIDREELAGSGVSFLTPGRIRTLTGPIKKELLAFDEIFVIINGSFSKDPYEKEIIPYLESFKFNFRDNKFLGKYEINVTNLKALMGSK